MAHEPKKVVPRNLTAWAATYQVPGNPVNTRPEDAVANCYPGLELDVRNLDRRFFPGLVFDFVARDDVSSPYREGVEYGARLAYLDDQLDPDLIADTDEAKALATAISDSAGVLAEGIWYLEWLEQGDKRLSLRFPREPGGKPEPLDGLIVWRIVRSLEPLRVKVCLKRRDASAGDVVLDGWRRTYVDPLTGVISGAYQPGELMQSLCSPWQHDFRDCACHYWAASRPDVVHPEVCHGEPTYPGGAPEDPLRADLRLDWLRAHRSRELAASALDSLAKNRPYQLDHFEINHAWQTLNVVLNNTEIGGLYVPRRADHANPFSSPHELAKALSDELAPLEIALAIEYLYARFSLKSPEEAHGSTWTTLADDLIFARHYLMLAATSEMQHLRWANELLWLLYDAKLIPAFQPVLTPARDIPRGPDATRRRGLRRLTPEVLHDFIVVEYPSGLITGAYARVVATLRLREYPPRMKEIAERIVSDGVQHEGWFRDIQRVLGTYAKARPAYPYLRDLQPDTSGAAGRALEHYRAIIASLTRAYRDAADGRLPQSGQMVAQARLAMNELLVEGERLAERGIGIPFWVDGPSSLSGRSPS